MKDFSQYGEQKHILGHFGGELGSFLSLGENDGETFSMVRALALSGWGGFCVEPAPIPFAKLEELYKDNSNVFPVNVAIATKDGEIDFWDSGPHIGNGDTSLLSTTVFSEVTKWKGKAAFRKTTCKAMSFETFIGAYDVWLTQRHANFISIDCEGQDWNILQQMDLVALGCELLCIEGNLHKEPQNEALYTEYVAKQGFRLKFKNSVNLLFEKV